ncbi:MAG: hypothetical protein JO025_02015 [Verrucomicrobia bacterium]|nr:hypothetical protein [Verrucomicrobiota bacterium]
MPIRRDVGKLQKWAAMNDDHEAMFVRNYEQYQSVKQRGETPRLFALRALVQLHDISGGWRREEKFGHPRAIGTDLDSTLTPSII